MVNEILNKFCKIFNKEAASAAFCMERNGGVKGRPVPNSETYLWDFALLLCSEVRLTLRNYTDGIFCGFKIKRTKSKKNSKFFLKPKFFLAFCFRYGYKVYWNLMKGDDLCRTKNRLQQKKSSSTQEFIRLPLFFKRRLDLFYYLYIRCI